MESSCFHRANTSFPCFRIAVTSEGGKKNETAHVHQSEPEPMVQSIRSPAPHFLRGNVAPNTAASAAAARIAATSPRRHSPRQSPRRLTTISPYRLLCIASTSAPTRTARSASLRLMLAWMTSSLHRRRRRRYRARNRDTGSRSSIRASGGSDRVRTQSRTATSRAAQGTAGVPMWREQEGQRRAGPPLCAASASSLIPSSTSDLFTIT
mmetsp:Transcript_38151/g.77843  ORF Transcript_38151/g.77843 Transcript_38151/m.77843 type:complete len:209 (-) Transcript_38151:92-718(-)